MNSFKHTDTTEPARMPRLGAVYDVSSTSLYVTCKETRDLASLSKSMPHSLLGKTNGGIITGEEELHALQEMYECIAIRVAYTSISNISEFIVKQCCRNITGDLVESQSFYTNTTFSNLKMLIFCMVKAHQLQTIASIFQICLSLDKKHFIQNDKPRMEYISIHGVKTGFINMSH